MQKGVPFNGTSVTNFVRITAAPNVSQEVPHSGKSIRLDLKKVTTEYNSAEARYVSFKIYGIGVKYQWAYTIVNMTGCSDGAPEFPIVGTEVFPHSSVGTWMS